MRFLVFIQSLTLNAIWFFCSVTGIIVAYYGFQKSVLWGIGGIVVGFLVAGILFTIGQVIYKLLFGMIYTIVMPKELKAAMRNRDDL